MYTKNIDTSTPLFHFPALVVSDNNYVIYSIFSGDARTKSSKLGLASNFFILFKKSILHQARKLRKEMNRNADVDNFRYQDFVFQGHVINKPLPFIATGFFKIFIARPQNVSSEKGNHSLHCG
jgi:hypothetical protein